LSVPTRVRRTLPASRIRPHLNLLRNGTNGKQMLTVAKHLKRLNKKGFVAVVELVTAVVVVVVVAVVILVMVVGGGWW